MMSLFSPFDTYFFSSSLAVLLFSFFMLVSSYKMSNHMSLLQLFNLLISFLYSLKPKMVSKFSIMITVSIFIMILSFNFLSVFPFVFPATSSFGVILFFSLIVWGGFISFMMIKNFVSLVSHFVPEGSPLSLVPALFLIEMVSSVIRPITLTVRLVANILAGHLLMILLSSLVFLFPYSFILYVLLNCVELFVALIQSYIFCTMMSLYYSEVH